MNYVYPVPVRFRRWPWPAFSSLALLASGCAEPAGPALATGAVVVTVSTAGFSRDSIGYTVALNETERGTIDPQDSLTIGELTPGDYAIHLRDVDDNCGVEPASVQQVRITEGTPSRVAFRVRCDSVLRRVILFQRFVGGSTLFQIMQIRPDGTDLQLFLDGGASPSVTPDGRQVVFWTQSLEIVIADVAGGPWTQLTTGNNSHSPAVSPDGRKIAFISNRSGEWQLYTMAIDGSDVRRLTTSNVQESGPPVWSPDASDILIGRADSLVIARVDGSGERVIAGLRAAGPLDWSVEDVILYNGVASGSNKLWVTDPWGLAPHLLLDNPGDEFEEFGRWSPDGRQVVLDHQVPGVHELFIADADGQGMTPLLTVPPNEYYVLRAWLP